MLKESKFWCRLSFDHSEILCRLVGDSRRREKKYMIDMNFLTIKNPNLDNITIYSAGTKIENVTCARFYCDSLNII